MSATPFNTFGIFKCTAKELVHILQKSEGPLEFGVLPLLGVFLELKKSSDTTFSTHEHMYVLLFAN